MCQAIAPAFCKVMLRGGGLRCRNAWSLSARCQPWGSPRHGWQRSAFACCGGQTRPRLPKGQPLPLTQW